MMSGPERGPDNSMAGHHHRFQKRHANESESEQRHTCSTGSHLVHQQRKQSIHSPPLPPSANNNNNGLEQFVNSLVSRKSFLGHISIEPLAFMVMLAFYIEFPAIQDLIYTKICLEVIASHPNLTLAVRVTDGAGLSAPQLGDDTLTRANTSGGLSASFSADGRIQQQATSTTPLSISQLTVPHAPSYQDEHRHTHLLCDRLNKTAVPRHIRQEVLDSDSLFWLKYQIVTCSLSALASPYWGGLSDRIGRLVPMNAPIIASILCNSISLVFGLLISLDSQALFHINWLYVGAVVVGLSGGQPVLIMNAFSFVSDNTTTDERSKRATVLESVVFAGHSLGFFLSKLIMELGLAAPQRPWLNRHFVAFGACATLNLLSVLYTATRLRHHKFHRFLNNFEREQQETAIMSSDQVGGSAAALDGGARGGVNNNNTCELATGERLRELTSSTPDDPDGPIARADKANWSFRDSMITFRYYRETYTIATKRRDTRSILLLLLLSGFISALSLATLMSLLFIYVKMDPFNWSTSQYSQWNLISCVARGATLILLTLVMRFVPSWNLPDPIVAGVGFLSKGAGLLMVGLAQSSSMLNWSLLAFAFSEYSTPPVKSLLSKLVVREELGKVYSCLGALQSFCFILGNVAFYVTFTSYMQQDFFRLAFLVVAGIEFGAVILVLVIYTAIRRQIPQILL